MTKVKKCGDCPFWQRSKEMECIHPNSPKGYDSLIGWDNVEKSPPKWCPLRKEDYSEKVIVNGKITSERYVRLIL